MSTNKYTKKELDDFKKQIMQKKDDVLKDIIKSQDIADNMLENSNTSSVNYSSHLGLMQEQIIQKLKKHIIGFKEKINFYNIWIEH